MLTDRVLQFLPSPMQTETRGRPPPLTRGNVMRVRLWLVFSPLAAATATYLAAAPHPDVPAKAQGSAISRAVEAFDQAGVTYGYRQLGGKTFPALAARM